MRWLIVCNGEKLSPTRLRELAVSRHVLACDGAIHDCVKHGVAVDILLGDFDSISSTPCSYPTPRALCPESTPTPNSADKPREVEGKTEIRAAEGGHQTISAPDQSKTDSEKALLHLIDMGSCDIVLCQAMGDRIDHSLINLGLLSRYHARDRKLLLAREHENIRFCRNETVTLVGNKGDNVSIIGFSEAVVTTSGLQYECDKLKIGITGASSGCNALAAEKADIQVVGDALVSWTNSANLEAKT